MMSVKINAEECVGIFKLHYRFKLNGNSYAYYLDESISETMAGGKLPHNVTT